jgi:hypothetical protein
MRLVSDYITVVREHLFDPAPGAGWNDDELIGYLNGALTRIVLLKQDAYPVIRELTLVEGVVQELPEDGALFLDVLYNAAGNGVTVQSAHEFVRVNPGWAAATSSYDIEYVLFDTRLPRRFHVSPPATDGATLMVMFGAFPPRLEALSDPVLMPDEYESAIWSFMTGQAYTKASKRQDLAKAQVFMQAFHAVVGGRAQADAALPPPADTPGVR